ncbi:hypothetical protein C9374_005899 [Naegleria lovaniensis]|uniref:EGF-like domain-containing protein n=1 Tax=Naegleria lovaniensis TaxID=51637 RepID=A0AA88GPH6_NAELO|nr:uncharacterized protein C9374_005899 [Naegleria lovaniensis]KAG2382107.1 hypothetical protein C9374_005899 [Naegleria lovaniensis]
MISSSGWVQVLLNGPTSVVVNSKGDLFIADNGNQRIRKVSVEEGTITTIAGTSETNVVPNNDPRGIYHALTSPFSLTLHPNDDIIYFSDNGQVLQLNQPQRFGVDASNSSVCSGRGNCTNVQECECIQGWGGPNCQFPLCQNIRADSVNVCGGHGTCTSPDVCVCHDSTKYAGANCEIPKCFGQLATDPKVCTFGNGTCKGPDQCVCSSPWISGPECDSPVTCFDVPYHNSSSVCSGNGQCVSSNNCTCIPAFVGKACQLQTLANDATLKFNVSSVYAQDFVRLELNIPSYYYSLPYASQNMMAVFKVSYYHTLVFNRTIPKGSYSVAEDLKFQESTTVTAFAVIVDVDQQVQLNRFPLQTAPLSVLPSRNVQVSKATLSNWFVEVYLWKWLLVVIMFWFGFL